MGIPVVIASNGKGMPVRTVESHAPVMTVAANGKGIPIVISDRGVPFIVEGAEPVEGFTLTTGDGGGIVGYSDGSLAGFDAFGSIDGDVSSLPVIQIIASFDGDVIVYSQGDNVSAMTDSLLVIDGEEFTPGTPTYSNAGGENTTFATYTGDEPFEFVVDQTYHIQLILSDD